MAKEKPRGSGTQLRLFLTACGPCAWPGESYSDVILRLARGVRAGGRKGPRASLLEIGYGGIGNRIRRRLYPALLMVGATMERPGSGESNRGERVNRERWN
jgi:hypothetical protein